MSDKYFFYTDEQGNKTDSIIEIVKQETEILAFCYVEKHGKAPAKELIDQWVHKGLTSMGWYD